MSPIEYPITPIKQNTSECMQTSATQMLSYHEPGLSVQDVIEEVPVYIDENGEKIGTSPGHLAAYCARKGYSTAVHIFDTELFDRSWRDRDLTADQVVDLLRQRQPAIPANSWLDRYHHILVDGWRLFAEAGGRFVFPQLSVRLLRQTLDDGPFILMVNSTYLNGSAKQRYDPQTDSFVDDPLAGRSMTHATTCAGYKDGQFLLVDPDPPPGVTMKRWVDQDHVIASIMAAQTESDNLLLTVKR